MIGFEETVPCLRETNPFPKDYRPSLRISNSSLEEFFQRLRETISCLKETNPFPKDYRQSVEETNPSLEEFSQRVEETNPCLKETNPSLEEFSQPFKGLVGFITEFPQQNDSDDNFWRKEDICGCKNHSQEQWKVAYKGRPFVYDSNEDQRSRSWQRRLYRVKKKGPERRQHFVSFDTNTNPRSFAWQRRFNKEKKIYVDRKRCFVYIDSIENPRSCAWRRRIYMIMEGPHVDDYNTQLLWIPMMSRWSSSRKRKKKKHLSDTCVVSEWPDKWKRRPNIHLSLKFVKAGGIESENVRVITTWGNYLVSVLSFCVYATDVDLQKILGPHWRKFSNHKKRKRKSLGSKMIKNIAIEAAPPDKQFR